MHPDCNTCFLKQANKLFAKYKIHHDIRTFDASSTLLDRCSSEFIKTFNKANVIISKGQGNLEEFII